MAGIGDQMGELSGKRILVVEDELLIATLTVQTLEDHGASVIGPCETLAEALSAIGDPHIDGAVLDVNLRGERVDPVVQALGARDVPIILVTGYLVSDWSAHRRVVVMVKPYDPEEVVKALAGLIALPSV
jgi:DNA-binding response OmpR family regulator